MNRLRVALFGVSLFFLTGLAVAEENVLTAEEKAEGWVLLFDGVSTRGWMTPKAKPLPERHVQNGALNPHPCDYMLVYEKPLGDFILTLDFKITPKCNSGVFLRTMPLEPRPGKDVGFNGMEVAIDATPGPGFHTTGAIYDLVSTKKELTRPVGEWNRMRLTSKNNRVVVEINGAVASEIDLDQWPEPNKRPDGSSHKFDVAYKNHPRTGYIGLQDHGSDCWYRNIKLKVIEAK